MECVSRQSIGKYRVPQAGQPEKIWRRPLSHHFYPKHGVIVIKHGAELETLRASEFTRRNTLPGPQPFSLPANSPLLRLGRARCACGAWIAHALPRPPLPCSQNPLSISSNHPSRKKLIRPTGDRVANMAPVRSRAMTTAVVAAAIVALLLAFAPIHAGPFPPPRSIAPRSPP